MRSINKVILIGNLTRDPEIRKTPGGQNVVTFSIATNREWITKDGRKQSSTEFHDLVAWAKLADICEKYLRKSKLVYIEGYLKTRNWTTPDGLKKFRTEIVVQDLIMLDKRGQDQGGEFDYVPEDEAPAQHSEPVGEENDEEMAEAQIEKQTAPEAPKKMPAKTIDPKSLDIDQDLGL